MKHFIVKRYKKYTIFGPPCIQDTIEENIEKKQQYIYTITYGFACSDMLSCVLLLMRVKQITITTVQGASIKQCNSRSI